LLHEAIINPQALFGESFMIRLQLENKARELHERLVRSFMDLIILRELGKGEALGGYDVISLINKRFQRVEKNWKTFRKTATKSSCS